MTGLFEIRSCLDAKMSRLAWSGMALSVAKARIIGSDRRRTDSRQYDHWPCCAIGFEVA